MKSRPFNSSLFFNIRQEIVLCNETNAYQMQSTQHSKSNYRTRNNKTGESTFRIDRYERHRTEVVFLWTRQLISVWRKRIWNQILQQFLLADRFKWNSFDKHEKNKNSHFPCEHEVNEWDMISWVICLRVEEPSSRIKDYRCICLWSWNSIVFVREDWDSDQETPWETDLTGKTIRGVNDCLATNSLILADSLVLFFSLWRQRELLQKEKGNKGSISREGTKRVNRDLGEPSWSGWACTVCDAFLGWRTRDQTRTEPSSLPEPVKNSWKRLLYLTVVWFCLHLSLSLSRCLNV
jgi:hypothetical protein